MYAFVGVTAIVFAFFLYVASLTKHANLKKLDFSGTLLVVSRSNDLRTNSLVEHLHLNWTNFRILGVGAAAGHTLDDVALCPDLVVPVQQRVTRTSKLRSAWR